MAWPDSTVSNNQFSSVTLNELAMNTREHTKILSFKTADNPKTGINPKEVQIINICLECKSLNLTIF